LNDTSLEALFRRREVDVAGFIENPEWVFDIKREKPELEFFRTWISGWINSRFKVFCQPFDDVRVRKAIHLATERQQIVDVIGSGEWRMQGPVGNAVSYWALPYDELLTEPGYRQASADRTADITTARQLYEAGKPGASAGLVRGHPQLHPELHRHLEAVHERQPGYAHR
jgi:ABC-type transport system substrate-binding protein